MPPRLDKKHLWMSPGTCAPCLSPIRILSSNMSASAHVQFYSQA